jgi:hypothetical protein
MGAGGGLVRDVLRRSGCYLRGGSDPQIAIVGLLPVRKLRRRHCLRGLFIAHFIALAAGLQCGEPAGTRTQDPVIKSQVSRGVAQRRSVHFARNSVAN